MRDAGRLRPENPASSRTRCRIGLRSSLTPDVCGNHRKPPSDMQRCVPSARCFFVVLAKRNEPRHGGRGPRFPTEDERVLAARSSWTLSEWYARGNAAADMAATGSVTAANTIGTEVVARCNATTCWHWRMTSGASVTNSVAYLDMLLASAAQR